MSDTRIADSIRRWGYLQADLDGLGRLRPAPHPDLEGLSGPEADSLRAAYCGTLAVEFMHMPLPDRCRWVAEQMEARAPAPDRDRLLRRLAESEILEEFLHTRYVGTRRYSLEGCCSLIVLLDALLDRAAGDGVEVVLIGMSHRGRLNVMAHLVGTPLPHIFAGFEDVDPRSVLGGGDVKYHRGATGTYRTAGGRELAIHLVSNPSHLEAVDPILVGRARARQVRLGKEGSRRVLPLLLHGDAAFAGQGIAAETLNLSSLEGFQVGGTVHVIVNNLIGFTTEPPALHSGSFASDVARRLPIPIFHVNAEDPEAADRAGRIGGAYRCEFESDVVLDLIGYRRYGHSEVDDPTVTQPLLYRRIHERSPMHIGYAERIGVPQPGLEQLESGIRSRLGEALEEARSMTTQPSLRRLPPWWDRFRGGRWEPGLEVATAVVGERLSALGQRITATPPGFHVHDKVAKILERRREMAEGRRPVDWGMAENLAFATLLAEGIPVRIAGQDTRRGTFGQRHAVLFDTEDGREIVPLASVAAQGAFFEARDTMLSEAASLGFEYGFSRDYPEALVCWEAQFGDFANGAQVILDQFVSAAEDKWGLLSGLVILLPHGYEGQGPEHSSARLERYLQLAAEQNIQICQPSTAAQYFHLLRRQALRAWRKPLIVLTPKSLLRAAGAASPLEHLAEGRFQPVIPDPELAEASSVLVGSGKVTHELLNERRRRGVRDVAVVRLEQIYPLPEAEISAALDAHAAARRIIWVQEEPANMGALRFVLPHLERLCPGRVVTSLKRSESASPATGSLKAHGIEQARLLDLAFSGSARSGL